MIQGVPGCPPGRTGRLWLRRRLETARRGSSLLDRRLQLLRRAQDILRAKAQDTAREWESRCAEADLWLLRATLLGGRRAVTLGASRLPAQVSVSYAVAAGVRYPADAACTVPEERGFDGPALARARQAYSAASAAAARHAAAAAAVRMIDAEVTATRYRLHAIEDRWIPRLERALAEVEFGLEELEHADGVRLRQLLNRRGER